MQKIELNRTAKASVFEDIFSDPENLLALYKALHPEDTETTIKDLKYVTLKNIITKGRFNDLGFMVGLTLLILMEAQSKWSFNIIPRLIMYLAETWNRYFIEKEYDLYGTKKIVIPEPELYVIYTGEHKIDKEYITLSEEFFNGKKIAVDARIKILKSTKGTDIITQYIRFCKIFDKQSRKYSDDTFKAINETIRICTSNEILKEYLQKRESEVVKIMLSLFNQEYATKMMIINERKEAKEEGIEEGKKEGIKEGIKEGKEAGIKEGEEKTALKLLSMKLLSIDEIAMATDLPVEKIKELAKA